MRGDFENRIKKVWLLPSWRQLNKTACYRRIKSLETRCKSNEKDGN